MTQALNDLSVAADGSVLGIDSGGNILQAVTGPSWNTFPLTNIKGQVTNVGVASDGTIMAISTAGSVWQYNASASDWTAITCPYPIEEISVGSATNIWSADGAGNVYQYIPGTGFTPRPDDIYIVSATSDGSVWAIDGSGAPRQYDATNNAWAAAPSNLPEAFTSLSAGTADSVSAVGKSGKVYQYDAGNPTPWVAVTTQLQIGFQSVSVGSDATMWALDATGNAYYYSMANQDWEPAPGQGSNLLRGVSVADAAQIMGVDGKGNIYQIETDGVTWKTIASNSNLLLVSVGSDKNVWGLDRKGNVYQNTGGLANWAPQSIAGETLSVVSAGADGTVWGLIAGSTQGNVVRYVDATTGWEKVAFDFTATDISVGNAKTIMISDGAGKVYEYLGADQWQLLPANNTTATDISVASDGAMWGIDGSNQACVYVDKNVGWYSTPQKVRLVAVGSSTNVWAIDSNGNAIQLLSNAAMLSEGSIVRPRPSIAAWDTENPFDEVQSTHLWIVNRAANLAGQDTNSGAQLLQLFPPFQGQIGPDGPDQGFHDQVCQGLYDVDFLPKYNGPVFLGRQPTYASHFYDPDTGMNWMYSHSWTALVQGRKFFWEALEYYVKGDLPTAGYKLGLSLHYLTDLTQPMHAANYTVLTSSDMGYHTAFETYVMEMQSGVPAPVTLQSSPFGGDPGEYFISAAMNSKHTYLADITPASVANAFDSDTGLTSAQCAIIQPFIKPILTDAINITAEYLVGWMAMTDSDITLCQLISSNSGYAIDISNSSTSAGAQAQQYTWNNTIAQQFQLLRLSSDEGYCSIIAKCSGMALDIQGQSTQPNTPVVQNPYNASSDSQKWQIVNIDEATISFQNKNSNLMLTVQSPLQESGSELIQATPENSGAQQWQLAAADPVNLVLPGTQLSVDVQNSASGAAALQIYNSNTTNAQVFLLVPLGGADAGYYMILSACAGYAISGASQQVMQEQWNSSDAQKWMQVPDAVDDNIVFLQNKASKEFLFAATDGSGQYQSGTALTTAPTTGVRLFIVPVTTDTAVETAAEKVGVKAAASAAG